MIPYYMMMAVPIVFYLLYGGTNQYLNNHKKQKATLIAFFAILFVILICRDKTVGIDLSSYLPRFESVTKLSFSDISIDFEDERGYWLLNKVIGLFALNDQWFLFVMAVITLIPICVLYVKESENALLTIAIFLILPNFLMLFSGIRQAIAIAIVAMSFKYVKEKKLLKFILIILLATTFHNSAFIAFLLYPLYYANITKAKLLAFVPVIIAVLVYNRPIFEFLLQFMGEYSEKYEYEVTNAYTMIILFALFVIFAYIVPVKENLDKNTIGLRNLSILVLVLQIFALANTVAMRMNYYFIMFMPLLISNSINRASEKNKQVYRYVGAIMIIFFFIYFINDMHNGEDTLQVFPYKAFWE